MSADPYNARVRELFADPRHAGSLAVSEHDVVRVTHYEQGIDVELSAAVADGRIERLAYRIRGCPHSIAACEAFCREFAGSEAARLAKFSAAELMQSLAVPAAKSARILALEDTVRQLETALRAPNSSAG